MKSVLLHVGYVMDPDNFKVSKTTDDLVGPVTNTENGDPTFKKVENLGGRSISSYGSVFVSVLQGNQYRFCFLPVGFQPVPENEDNTVIHTHRGWNFSTNGGRRGNTRML